MTTRKKTPTETVDSGVRYDVETLVAMALKVKAEGFVPATSLREEFGPEKYTQGIAVIFRDFRMFREVRRPWKDNKDALGYEWADRRFSRSEIRQIPPVFGPLIELTQALRPRYGDFVPVTVKCRWTTPILGSVPVKQDDQDMLNTFERDSAGNALVLRYHQRAMATMALPMIGKEQSVARRIGWSTIRVPLNGNLKTVQHGVVPPPGQSGDGKGLKKSEAINAGQEFEIKAMVPTTALSMDEFLRMVTLAGTHIGLSPGRSAGFGDFEVLGAE